MSTLLDVLCHSVISVPKFTAFVIKLYSQLRVDKEEKTFMLGLIDLLH